MPRKPSNQQLLLLALLAVLVTAAGATTSYLPIPAAGVCLVVLAAISLPLPEWL